MIRVVEWHVLMLENLFKHGQIKNYQGGYN